MLTICWPIPTFSNAGFLAAKFTTRACCGRAHANRPVPTRLSHLSWTGEIQQTAQGSGRFPDMESAGGQTPIRVCLALIDGNFAEAERVLAASPRQDFQDIDFSFYYPKTWFEAMIARAKGDSARATAAFSAARAILEQRLVVKPEHARTIAVLAQVDAGLGHKELAIQEAQHAVDLMPSFKRHLRWRVSA